MSIESLMQTCEALGIKIGLKDDGSDRLIVDAPKGVLTPSLRDELTARKAQLISHLKTRGQSAPQVQAINTTPSSETEAPTAQRNIPEAISLIHEQPLSVTSTQFERAEGEVKKLLANREYDVNVIDAADSATRQIISAQLLAALTGGNRDHQDAARRGFMGHGYFDDTTRQLRMADSPTERAAAARKLGIVNAPTVTSHLIAALFDTAPEVRRAAVESLAQTGDLAAISPLHDLLSRETSRQLPEAIIRHAINAITVTQAKQASKPIPAAQVLQQPPAVATPVDTAPVKREIFSEYLNAPVSQPVVNVPVAPPVVNESFAATEERLRVEEAALRRAAGELERKRIAAEVARQKAEDEAKEKAQREAAARLEIEARVRAEEEMRRRAAEEAARKKAEEEARIRAEREARTRAEQEARQRAEEEAQFRLEAETLRKAAEEIAKQRAEAEAARRLAEEEARRRAEEEARRRAEEEAKRKLEDELRARAIEEARRKAEEEIRLRVEEELRRRAEEETRRKLEAEAQARAAEEARLRAEV
ncbi:MAG TPA: HEAT repeat domain-containing protein, partial [Pyrinomonadaceae bacterium]|nr:HEAT repeat domain-containing protein [Pyrinomonadaceae bacterium]